MKKTFKKVAASVLAVTTLAVGTVGMSAYAENIEVNNYEECKEIVGTEYLIFLWKNNLMNSLKTRI